MPQALGAIAINVALSVGTYVLSRALTPKTPNIKTTDAVVKQPEAPLGERTLTVRQPLPPRRFAYGAGRIGGIVFIQDTINPLLYVGGVICDGPIGSVTGLYIGNQQITLAAESPAGQAASASGSQYYERVNLSYRLGTDSQTIDPFLSGNFGLTSNFRQRGVATFVCKLHWGNSNTENSALWSGGIEPSVTGTWRTVYDPRDGAQAMGTESTWTYSANPVLHVAHALTNAWGVALPTSAIDWDSVETAADICDATVTYNSQTVATFVGGGVFEATGNLAGQIAEMLAAFRGHIIYSDGLYKIVADAARTSVWTITDDDILEVGEYIASSDSGELYTTIKTIYASASDASRTTESKVYEDAAAVTVEGRRETAIREPFCAAEHSAQILAYRKLYEMRNGRRLAIRVSDAGLFLDAFEVVTVSSTAFPFLNGTYQVDMTELVEEGVTLTLREYVSQLYTNPTTYFQV